LAAHDASYLGKTNVGVGVLNEDAKPATVLYGFVCFKKASPFGDVRDIARFKSTSAGEKVPACRAKEWVSLMNACFDLRFLGYGVFGIRIKRIVKLVKLVKKHLPRPPAGEQSRMRASAVSIEMLLRLSS
jgi:hypothetical protein